jgi:hypothetical protein
MESRFTSKRGNSRKFGGFKSHDYISRERTERRTACHAHTTGGFVTLASFTGLYYLFRE